jgi:RNA polymerase sigma-70 factor (ECF subfamily)
VGVDLGPTSTGFAEVVESERPLLVGISYRITGDLDDAEEIAQETFARAIEQPPADRSRAWRPWLVRVATNLSIDALRRRKHRAYEGPWLPTPIGPGLADIPEPGQDPGARYELLESTSFAFLLALEALGPRQRAALILMDVLGYSASEAARPLGTTESNARVLLHRARKRLAGYDAAARERAGQLPAAVRTALSSLVRCLAARDVEALERLLSEDVRALTDGGGEYTALRAELVGRQAVARLLSRVADRRLQGARIHELVANGAPAVLVEFARTERRQAPRLLLRGDLDAEGQVGTLHVVLSGSKLAALSRTARGAPALIA